MLRSTLLAAMTVLFCAAPCSGHAAEATRHVSRRTLWLQTTQLRESKTIAPVSNPDLSKATGSGTAGYPVEIVRESGAEDQIFAAQVEIKNLDTDTTVYVISQSGNPKVRIGPGRYRLYTESATKDFPQEAKYQILDAASNRIVEEFAKSHVPVTDVLVEKGQKLRVMIPPSIRPYNSSFFTLGSDKQQVAVIFARPYPSFEFAAGEFDGEEEFSSAQIALAFWGMKAVRDNPRVASAIEKHGVPGLRQGPSGLVKDPVIVLGSRVIAKDLAKTFIHERLKNNQGYRGQNHTIFLINRTAFGKVPRSLLRLPEDEVANAIERNIVRMELHNVHRVDEGDGYAGQSFMKDLEEAKDAVMKWPKISYETTEQWRSYLRELEIFYKNNTDPVVAEDAKSVFADGYASLLRAIKRERAIYTTYPAEWLTDIQTSFGISFEQRNEALISLERETQGLLGRQDGH